MTLEIKLAIAAVMLALLGYFGYRIEKHGYDRCDVIYQAHLSADKAAIDAATKLSEDTNATVQKQHQIDVQSVKSKAGQSAIAEYIRTHGMLSDCVQMQPASGVQANIPEVIDGTARELGTGAGIARFAERCASDALKVMECSEWAAGNKLPVQ